MWKRMRDLGRVFPTTLLMLSFILSSKQTNIICLVRQQDKKSLIHLCLQNTFSSSSRLRTTSTRLYAFHENESRCWRLVREAQNRALSKKTVTKISLNFVSLVFTDYFTFRPPSSYGRGTSSSEGDGTPIDCQHTPWGPWTECSKTCGKAHKTRRRNIKQHPMNGGRECPGKIVQRRRCKENPPCTRKHSYPTSSEPMAWDFLVSNTLERASSLLLAYLIIMSSDIVCHYPRKGIIIE